MLFSLRSHGEFGFGMSMRDTGSHRAHINVERWTSRRDRLQVNTDGTWCLVCLQTSGGNVYKTHGTSRKLYHFSDSISEARLFPNIRVLLHILCNTIFHSFGFHFISIHFSTGPSQFGKSKYTNTPNASHQHSKVIEVQRVFSFRIVLKVNRDAESYGGISISSETQRKFILCGICNVEKLK